MSATARAGAALVAYQAVVALRPRWPRWARVVPFLVVWSPGLAVAAGAAGAAALALRGRFARRAAARSAAVDVVALAELMSLALSGGMGLRGSLEHAARQVDPGISDNVDSVLRRSRVEGLASALVAARGPGRDLFRLVARAAGTGAQLVPALEDFVHARVDEKRALEMAAARRLPVHMLFPLALLILPGFLVLSIGPAVLSATDRLGL